MKTYSDQEVIKMIQSGATRKEDRALEYLYAQYYSLIEKLIKNNNGTEIEAADVFQDSIIVLYNQLKSGEVELNCTIKTYLYSVSRNLWLRELRLKNKQVDLMIDNETVPIEERQLKRLESNEQSELIAQLIKKLGEECQKILLLFYFEKLRMDDIANRLNLKTAQVAKNKKARCLKRLKAAAENSTVFYEFFKGGR